MNLQLSPLLIGLYILCFIVSLGFHEAMHALVAYKLGDNTASAQGRVTLNPFKHIDPYTTILLPGILLLLHLPPFLIAKPVPVDFRNLKYDEYGMALVGIAGPFTNLFLAIIGAVFFRTLGQQLGGIVYQVSYLFITVNVFTFIFNMIPFPPLDGSRLLYAFAPESLQKIMEQIEAFGLPMILVFMFLLFPLISPIIMTINNQILTLLLT